MIKLSQGRGKIQNIISINTSPYNNQFCYKNFCNSKSICHYCYSVYSLYSFFQSVLPNCLYNSKLLKKPLSIVPILNYAFIRFNSHGEIYNRIHFQNIIDICIKNPWTHFSLMSKRKDIISRYKKPIPKNLIIVYSNPIVNKIIDVPKGFHKVFNVVNNDTLINCKNHCIDCLKCYKRTGERVIIEKEKYYSKCVNTSRKNILKLFKKYKKDIWKH